jgi:hypothetical protein
MEHRPQGDAARLQSMNQTSGLCGPGWPRTDLPAGPPSASLRWRPLRFNLWLDSPHLRVSAGLAVKRKRSHGEYPDEAPDSSLLCF